MYNRVRETATYVPREILFHVSIALGHSKCGVSAPTVDSGERLVVFIVKSTAKHMDSSHFTDC